MLHIGCRPEKRLACFWRASFSRSMDMSRCCARSTSAVAISNSDCSVACQHQTGKRRYESSEKSKWGLAGPVPRSKSANLFIFAVRLHAEELLL